MDTREKLMVTYIYAVDNFSHVSWDIREEDCYMLDGMPPYTCPIEAEEYDFSTYEVPQVVASRASYTPVRVRFQDTECFCYVEALSSPHIAVELAKLALGIGKFIAWVGKA